MPQTLDRFPAEVEPGRSDDPDQNALVRAVDTALDFGQEYGMRVMGQIRSFLNAGLAYVYPEVCSLCEQVRATPEEGFVCEDCRSQVSYIEPPYCGRCGCPFAGAITQEFECGNCRGVPLHFEWARSAAQATGPVLESIHRYKYNRALWLEPFLAGLLLRQAQPTLHPAEWDLIVPVPLYPAKQREREFNQSERLARRLARATQIPCANDVLQRVLPTPSQTRLNRQERAENVRKAFALRRRSRVNDLRILLVDDVMTTGATTNACAKVLRDAGAARVCVWTVARGT